MKTVLSIFGCLALLSVSWVCGETALTVRYARQRSIYSFDQLNKVLRESSQTLDEVRKGATTWNSASAEQASATTKAMSNVSVAVSQFSSFISKTDNSVNALLVPNINNVIVQENQSLLQTQADLQANLKEVLYTTTQLQKTIQDADAQISNPDVQKSLDNLAAATQNATSATKHLDTVTADAEKTADYYTKRLTTPQSFLKTVGQAILQLGSEARILFGH